MPQVRGTAAQFISRVSPDTRTIIRTRPLEALIIGGYVRGPSDRNIESLMQEAGLGQVSKSTASRICRELLARYKVFCARSLAEVELIALFLDAIYLPTRPSGEKEGVLVAFDRALVMAISRADAALSELAGVGRLMPNPHLFIAPFLRREAVYSSRIEGTRTNLEQLLLEEGISSLTSCWFVRSQARSPRRNRAYR